jgi:hypothetical protein
MAEQAERERQAKAKKDAAKAAAADNNDQNAKRGYLLSRTPQQGMVYVCMYVCVIHMKVSHVNMHM